MNMMKALIVSLTTFSFIRLRLYKLIHIYIIWIYIFFDKILYEYISLIVYRWFVELFLPFGLSIYAWIFWLFVGCLRGKNKIKAATIPFAHLFSQLLESLYILVSKHDRYPNATWLMIYTLLYNYKEGQEFGQWNPFFSWTIPNLNPVF